MKYTDPSGLKETTVSTAEDQVKLGNELGSVSLMAPACTKEFFDNADATFYRWNEPLHGPDGPFSRLFDYPGYRGRRVLEIEAELVRKGLSEREVKRGRGGIRDIEFSVQLLQLVHGRADPALRSPTTLDALAELGAGGYIEPEDARSLDYAYRLLRTVEHRLQLVAEQQVHTLPAGGEAMDRLARVMGYRDTADAAHARYGKSKLLARGGRTELESRIAERRPHVAAADAAVRRELADVQLPRNVARSRDACCFTQRSSSEPPQRIVGERGAAGDHAIDGVARLHGRAGV